MAEVCLGNMGNAKGAAAVRRAKADEPEKEAAVAQVRAGGRLVVVQIAERERQIDGHACMVTPKTVIIYLFPLQNYLPISSRCSG